MEPWFERLGTLDALFLDLEDRTAHMHVGAVAIYDGAPPPYRDFLQLIESKLAYVPRYRQRLMFVPFGQGRPVWVDEAQFDLEFHVRHTALPAPGGRSELKKLAGRLLSQRLDRDRPLWELWLVEGLEGGGFAVISKTHHCLLDGVSGVDLASVLMETEPQFEPPPAPPHWTPRPAPKLADLLFTSMKGQISHPLQFVRELASSARAAAVGAASGEGVGDHDALRLVRELAAGIKPLLSFAGQGQAPPTSLNAAISPHRKFETVDIPLAEVKLVRTGLGGTVNDVVLAIVTGALRRYLAGRGEALGPDLRAMVPVSVRPQEQRGSMGNQVSAVFCPLPVGDPDPASRLRKVRESMKGLKESGQVIGAQALTRLGDFAPPTLVAQAARLQAVTRFFNIVVTNVPGPQFPLYLLGRKMHSCYPQVPLAAQQGVGIALLSYDGRIGVGLLGDADLAKDLDAFAAALRAALDELLVAAGRPVHSEPPPAIAQPAPVPAPAASPVGAAASAAAPAASEAPAPAAPSGGAH
jgi:WS/DGAT/MGAT family acyltransferase